MKPRPAIQKFIASLLLIVFAVSVAPKTYFHALIAHHKDVASCNQLHNTAVLHKLGYNCHFDELVVSGPFVLSADPAMSLACTYGVELHHALYTACFQFFTSHKENRGPPAS